MSKATAKLEEVPEDADGNLRTVEFAKLAATTRWKPSPAIPYLVNVDVPLDGNLVELLDSACLNSVSMARTLLALLEQRGWRGWTRLERVDPGAQRAAEPHLPGLRT